ncbi:unnamed protein product [Blepharisma stoltei]|uniref:Uncharacterized protein n=1 Tax=Blepharisma stoltei TaxID=1481888 RepID=A0AAU9IIY7_9CILI|nr:unnamed protein product [Blepharisma stoltei]
MVSYDISQDCYKDIWNLELNFYSSKAIFSIDNRVIVIEASDFTFRSGINDLTVWEKVNTNNLIGSPLCSHVIRFKSNVYFIKGENQLVEFNLKTNSLKEIEVRKECIIQ